MFANKVAAALRPARKWRPPAMAAMLPVMAALVLSVPSATFAATSGGAATVSIAAPLPSHEDAVLDFADARHLVLRTSFAPLPTDITALVGLTRAQAVDKLLDNTRTLAVTPEPDWVDKWEGKDIYELKLTKGQEKAKIAEQTKQRYETKLWWMHEIRTTPSPLTEQMVMFWHNYFTLGMSDILWVHFVFRNNTLIRRDALGNFRTMLHDMATDPGFMSWLNISDSSKSAPNENFAREIMELYTLGLGNYTEKDIIEVARALTGWKIDIDTGKPYFDPDDHDNGEKTILGQTGNFGLDDVIDILLQQEATAPFIVKRMWKHFVSQDTPPDAAELAALSAVLRGNDFEIRPLLRTLLLSDAFWSADNRGNMFKSPVELILGASRELNVNWDSDLKLVAATAHIGQDLMDHASVAGWSTGRGWVDTATLPQRIEYVTEALDEWANPPKADTQSDGTPKTFIDAWGNEREMGTGIRHIKSTAPPAPDSRRGAKDMLSHEQAAELARDILARPPLTPLPEGKITREEALRAIMLDPAYQFK